MPSGILLLDKPLGLSSNAVLQRVRALLLRQKAGHVGSLDPLATGMLPICLGEATKIAGQILAGRKRYRFTVALGSGTTTGDVEGAVTTTAPVPTLERAGLEAVLARFRGPQTQTPPMYSALKRAGQPLYKLARAGVTVARAARDIELFELALLALGPASSRHCVPREPTFEYWPRIWRRRWVPAATSRRCGGCTWSLLTTSRCRRSSPWPRRVRAGTGRGCCPPTGRSGT